MTNSHSAIQWRRGARLACPSSWSSQCLFLSPGGHRFDYAFFTPLTHVYFSISNLHYYDFGMNVQHPPGLPFALYWVTPWLKPGFTAGGVRVLVGLADVVHDELVETSQRLQRCTAFTTCRHRIKEISWPQQDILCLVFADGPLRFSTARLSLEALGNLEAYQTTRDPIVSDELQDWT